MAENVGKRGSVWFYRLDLPPGPEGRRRQRRVSGFPTERAARSALARERAAAAEGRLHYSAGQTFAALADEWLQVVGPNRKATTVANYRLLVDAYLTPRLGETRLDRITPPMIQKLYVELREHGGQAGRPLSGTQVRNIHRVLHNLLGYAVRVGYLSTNPADRVERPKDDTAERPVYTPEQVRRFLEVARGDRLHALWHLAISAGLRRAELAGLRWQDVELDAAPPMLNVRVARVVAASAVLESTPKTKAGRRRVVLDAASAAELVAHRSEMVAEESIRGARTDHDYVFVDEDGDPINPNRLTRAVHALQRKAGLPQITLHDLRHTSATIALLAGVHPKIVTERHGHASTQITLDRYSHVLESMQASAAEAIGRFLDPASGP